MTTTTTCIVDIPSDAEDNSLPSDNDVGTADGPSAPRRRKRHHRRSRGATKITPTDGTLFAQPPPPPPYRPNLGHAAGNLSRGMPPPPPPLPPPSYCVRPGWMPTVAPFVSDGAVSSLVYETSANRRPTITYSVAAQTTEKFISDDDAQQRAALAVRRMRPMVELWGQEAGARSGIAQWESANRRDMLSEHTKVSEAWQSGFDVV
jgi:hypothetical protein